MSHFLKESTFAINEVFSKSLDILKNNYLSVATLCFLMFIISNGSSALAEYLKHFNIVLSSFMALIFMVLYFGANLAIFKVVLAIIDNKSERSLNDIIPSTKELVNCFGSILIIFLSSIIILLLFSLICWPLIYLNIELVTMVNFVLVLSFLVTFLFIIRVAFYPFFILDKSTSSLQSIKLSFAMTRGNVFKLLFIMAVFTFMHIIQIYASLWLSFYIGLFLGAINAFLIVPLSSIVITVAYREMILGVNKEDNLDIFKNII